VDEEGTGLRLSPGPDEEGRGGDRSLIVAGGVDEEGTGLRLSPEAHGRGGGTGLRTSPGHMSSVTQGTWTRRGTVDEEGGQVFDCRRGHEDEEGDRSSIVVGTQE
jgi:hypothetical protein